MVILVYISESILKSIEFDTFISIRKKSFSFYNEVIESRGGGGKSLIHTKTINFTLHKKKKQDFHFVFFIVKYSAGFFIVKYSAVFFIVKYSAVFFNCEVLCCFLYCEVLCCFLYCEVICCFL